jgi:hypothetical protein
MNPCDPIAPRPWEFRDNGTDGGLDPCFCVAGEPREYGLIDIFETPHAEHVLKCVNNHDALVDALESTRDALQQLVTFCNAEHSDDPLWYEATGALCLANDALGNMEGGQP